MQFPHLRYKSIECSYCINCINTVKYDETLNCGGDDKFKLSPAKHLSLTQSTKFETTLQTVKKTAKETRTITESDEKREVRGGPRHS